MEDNRAQIHAAEGYQIENLSPAELEGLRQSGYMKTSIQPSICNAAKLALEYVSPHNF
jgi:hypothetical protein